MTATPDRVKHYDAVALAAATDGMTVAEFVEMKRDAQFYKWIKEHSSFGSGLADCHSIPRKTMFVRFPLLEAAGITLDDAIAAARSQS